MEHAANSADHFRVEMLDVEQEIINPVLEITSYEALWIKFKTVHRIAKVFEEHKHQLPSVVAKTVGLSEEEIEATKSHLLKLLPFSEYSAVFFRDFDYPMRLREAKNPVEILYYQGALDLLSSKKIVAIVGARKASPDGLLRARKLAKMLVSEGFVIMSGLAEGIDTAAHTAAIEAKGHTIAVIGTPLNECYPKENALLQKKISSEHLLVSQVPFYFYSKKDWRETRVFFPERNVTMSALSHATIIVEASDTSGSLYQARAAIQQNRKLFILNSCFEKNLKWPDLYQKKGAHRVTHSEEILAVLNNGML